MHRSHDEVLSDILCDRDLKANGQIMYSEVYIIEKLPLEKNPTYLITFLRTGKVQNNFDWTVINTYDFRFYNKISRLHLVAL